MSLRLPIVKVAGVDYFCLGKKFLVRNLVDRNLKIKYRRSILGILWTLLAPLAMAAVYYLVFKHILKIQTPHYVAHLLAGVLPWAFFASTLAEGMEAQIASAGLITKVPFPLQAMPFVIGVTNLITLVLALPIMVGASIISGVELGPSLLLIPPLYALLFLVAYSLGLIFSLAFVYFRDLRHLLGILLQLWFYGTPVLYPESMIPEEWRWVVHLNPVGDLFLSVQDVLVRGAWPSAEHLGFAAAWALFWMIFGALFFRRFSRGLVEIL